ncbi:MAG: hypothetical protein ACYSVY_25000 [Planctomycetota bacterium]|jgi:hypothetical protein
MKRTNRSTPTNEEIVIVVEDGVVKEVYNSPPHVTVRVKDHDVEGCDEADVQRDRDGELYCEAVWTGEDSCGPADT